jgi:hypothetical protein
MRRPPADFCFICEVVLGATVALIVASLGALVMVFVHH